MKELEAPDALITIARASEISGLSASRLRHAARVKGGLRTVKPGHDLLTTRRWLDRFLQDRGTRYRGPAPKELPGGYVPPPPGPGRPRKRTVEAEETKEGQE